MNLKPNRKGITHALDNNCHPARTLAAWLSRPHWRQFDPSTARNCCHRPDYQPSSGETRTLTWHVSARSKTAAPQPHYYQHQFAASLSGDGLRKMGTALSARSPYQVIVSTVSQMTNYGFGS